MLGKKSKSIAFLGASIAAISMGTGAAYAQPLPADEDAIFVTGSRGQARALKDSAVPIDVIGADELNQVSFTDTNDILQTLVPSYTLSRQPISDGGSFIRPASLRGLPTDKTLVLVNSKRRHRAALVSIGGSGTQGPDIATIPVSAIQTVEVLRDGAAAQYGSDAIAGVINFILKENSDGISLTAQTGQFYEGDGFEYMLAGNAGFDLFGKGFFSVSAEYYDAEATVRSDQYCEGFACVVADDPRFPGTSFDEGIFAYDEATFLANLGSANIGEGDVVQPWGQPNVNRFAAFYNMGYDLGGGTEFYSFGNYTESESDGSFFYRYPGNGTIENLRLEDGSLWSPLVFFPGGFTPRFFGEIQDVSLVGGLRGETPGGLTWDVSGRFGRNLIQYTLENTVNPSLGNMSPTSFRPGDLKNEEIQFQADFSKEYTVDSFASPLLMAFGLSYLDESYEVVGGETSSFEAGPFASQDPFGFCDGSGMGATLTAAGIAANAGLSAADQIDCTNEDDAAFTVVGVGSNGFPGYSPEFSEEYIRDSIAAYIDFSADVTEPWFVQLAGRIENYSDFGTEITGKFATQYDLLDTLSIRGSVSTGFRAPTPGQQGTTNVSTRLPNGFPVATGLFPASSPVSRALGADPLQPETSINYTAGLVGELFGIDYTIDFYRIEIDDRTYAISTLDVIATEPDPADFDLTDPDEVEDLADAQAAYANFLALDGAGVAGAESIGGVFYFQNAFDTTTQGVDVVLTKDVDFGAIGTTDFLVSMNYNETELSGGDISVLNAEEQFDFEEADPNFRAIVQATHNIGDFTVVGRANVWGPYENSDNGGATGLIQEFDTDAQFDLEVNYRVTDNYTFAIGARNIFDQYPDEADDAIGDSCCGRIYRSDSIVPWQGGFYYARVTAEF